MNDFMKYHVFNVNQMLMKINQSIRVESETEENRVISLAGDNSDISEQNKQAILDGSMLRVPATYQPPGGGTRVSANFSYQFALLTVVVKAVSRREQSRLRTY